MIKIIALKPFVLRFILAVEQFGTFGSKPFEYFADSNSRNVLTKSLATMDEREAIARLKRSDITGLDALVCTYQLQAVRAAYLVCGDRNLAEDVVQSAFVRAYERIWQFDATRSFGPWFLRSVLNDAIKAANHGRRYISLDAGEEDVSIVDLLAEPSLTPEEAMEATEVREAVAVALRKLSPSQRAIIWELCWRRS